MSAVRRKGMIAVALLAVLAGAVAALIWADNISTSQRADRDDLDLFLDASSAGWAEVTNQFFLVPEVAAQTIGALSAQMDTRDEQLSLLAETIRGRPNLDSAFIGYPDGRFFFVARSDDGATGGFRTRVIDFDSAGQRQVNLTWTDAALEPIRAEQDFADEYDPRQRPWYEPITGGEERNWTAPYVFASSQLPGITHSRAVRTDSGSLRAVVGIDIRLSRVNDFLEELSPGRNGTALVVDNTGRIIAESSMDLADLAPADSTGVVALSQSSELLALVNDFAAADSETLRGRSVDGLRTTIVRPAGARDEWYLTVRALDEDFLERDVASNAFETFAVALTVAAAVGGLGFAVLRYLSGLKNDAEIDELTGVYNRRAVKRQLRSTLARSNGPVHVAIIDLDNFKAINDEHGHAAGDRVLTVVAERMLEFAIMFGATAGRLGGDEFVVFGDGDAPDWSLLNRCVAGPVDIGDQELAVTASIGVADSGTAETDEIEDLFRAADHLLFDAKRHGGDVFRAAQAATN